MHGHVYDLMYPPPGLEGATAGGRDALGLLQREWLRLKETSAAGEGLEGQRRRCWVAVALASTYRRFGDLLRTRAVLETALDELDDEGHRHIVRCRLAREAALAGDQPAARGWLEECDPAQEVLELDGEYRLAAARIRLAEGDGAGALVQLGAQEGAVPIDPPHRLAFAELRVAAYEQAGQLHAALAELKTAEYRHGAGRLRQRLAASGMAPQVTAYLDRQDAAHRERVRALTEQAKRTAKKLGVAGAVALVVALVGYFAFRQLWARYQPLPISCGRRGLVILEDRVVRMPDEVLIDAEDGCRITISRCHLVGREVILGADGVEVTVVASTLDGRERVIDLNDDAKLRIGKKSELIGQSADHDVIDVDEGSTVRITNTTIKSAGRAFDVGASSKVDIAGSKILVEGEPKWAYVAHQAGTTRLRSTLLQTTGGAFELFSNTVLELDRSTIVAAQHGNWLLDGSSGTEVRCTGGRLSSAAGGMTLGSGAEVKLSKRCALDTKGIGIRGDDHLRVHVDGSELTAGQDGIACGAYSRVELSAQSKVEAGKSGILGGNRLQANVQDSRIRAGDAAISGALFCTVTATNAHLEGKGHSLQALMHSRLNLTKTKLVGPKNSSDCMRWGGAGRRSPTP